MIRLRSHVIKKLVKFCLIILLFMAPVMVLMLIFTPFASDKITQRIATSYKIPENYTHDDITQTVMKMNKDPEFPFYFSSLTNEEIVQATYEVYEVMNRARSAELLLAELNQQQQKTKALAVMFYHLDYTEEFINDPVGFPDLYKVMKALLIDDFKLAVLGVCYKSNYDEKYVMVWDQVSRSAARKLRDIMNKLND